MWFTLVYIWFTIGLHLVFYIWFTFGLHLVYIGLHSVYILFTLVYISFDCLLLQVSVFASTRGGRHDSRRVAAVHLYHLGIA